MEYSHLKIDTPAPGICVVAISAPKSLNALNSAILDELGRFVAQIDANQVRVLIVTGDGDRAFVAGADIAEMRDMNPQQALEFGRKGAEVFRSIERLPMPTIAAINGFALGGGCELAMACDMRIASEKAKFGQPEVGLGITPGFSGTVRLPRLVGTAVAKELIFSGRAIDAAEALRVGLVNAVCKSEELMEQALQMAGRMLKNAPLAIARAKQCIDEGLDMPIDEAIALENRHFAECFATADQKEGMSAFMAKSKANFTGK